MGSLLQQIFDATDFPPRWRCGNWSESLGWLHIISDMAIFGAYFAIPVVLAYFVLRRKDVPFPRIFWLFALFIMSCGIGHGIEATIFWHPWYRLSGVVKMITAIVSWATVIALIPLLPKALALPGLAKVNADLAREIEERKRAEERQRKLESQFQQAQKLESLGVLAGGIAHDFNNLLTSILGYADLASHEVKPGTSAHNHITEAISGARRAAELTNQMLAFSGKGRFVIEPLNINEVVEGMSRLLQVSISKKCVLQIRPAPNLPAIETDGPQLRQIIMNLIINASEAIGDQNGVINISTGVMECDQDYLSASYLDDHLPAGTYVYIEVTDTGCGMTEDVRVKIFDPFYTTKFTGRGLGLAAVLGIVRGHRGAIKVYSEPGKGTMFKVLFPASKLPAKTTGNAVDQTASWHGSGTVLVVDDEDSVRRLAGSMLQRMGFSVLYASDGLEGVETFRKESGNIRLVLLDMTMPRMNGEEAFREMRHHRNDMKAILSSGYNEQTATNHFTGKGLAGFIQKPYSYENLQAIVRKVLQD